MQANHKIGYSTRITDIIRMVWEDFNVYITPETANLIFEANNAACLIWDESGIKSTRYNIEIAKRSKDA
jgi:hypothetical protein